MIRILTIFAFALFVLCRCFDLTADLPSYFDAGISVTDEGTYMDAPKKKVEIGQWNLPGEWWHSQKLVPLYSYVLWRWFEFWDVSLVSGRSLSVGLSFLILALAWFFGKRLYGAKGGLALLVLVGSSYILTHFNRAAMVETMQLVFIWAAIVLLTYRACALRDFLVGLCLISVVMVKLSGALVLPGLIAWYFLADKIWCAPKRFLALVCGLCGPLVLVEICSPGFMAGSLGYSQTNFGSLLNVMQAPWHFLHFAVRSMYLSREAPMVLLAVAGLWGLLRSADRKTFEPYVWAFVGSVVMCSMVDSAVRRYLLLMPWLYLFALQALFFRSGEKTYRGLSLFVLICAQAIGMHLMFSGIPMVFGHFDLIPVKVWAGLGFVAALIFVFLCLNQARKSDRSINDLICFRLDFLSFFSRNQKQFCLLALLFFVCQQTQWTLKRTHHTHEMIKKVVDYYQDQPQAIVYGNIAPMMVLESKAQSFFLHKKMGPFEKWNFPDEMDLITYTQPKLGYESQYVAELLDRYPFKANLFENPMFAEAHLERAVGLLRLKK